MRLLNAAARRKRDNEGALLGCWANVRDSQASDPCAPRPGASLTRSHYARVLARVQFVSKEAQRIKLQRYALAALAALLAAVLLAALVDRGHVGQVRGATAYIHRLPAAQADGSGDNSSGTSAAADQEVASQQQQEQQQPQQQAVNPSDLECARSGYCSLGVSKTWVGDVATNEALREAMEAISYKKEVGGRVGVQSCPVERAVLSSLHVGAPLAVQLCRWSRSLPTTPEASISL